MFLRRLTSRNENSFRNREYRIFLFYFYSFVSEFLRYTVWRAEETFFFFFFVKKNISRRLWSIFYRLSLPSSFYFLTLWASPTCNSPGKEIIIQVINSYSWNVISPGIPFNRNAIEKVFVIIESQVLFHFTDSHFLNLFRYFQINSSAEDTHFLVIFFFYLFISRKCFHWILMLEK